MSPVKEVSLVVAHEFKQVLLSVRSVLFFVVYGGISFIVGSSYTRVVSFFDKALAEQLGPVSGDDLANAGVSATKIFSELFEKDPELISVFGGQHVADALISGQLPVVIFAWLVLSGWFLPSLLLVIGYDRISEDLNGKFSRFVFLRLRRGTYLCGKIFAQWLVAILLIAIVHGILLSLVSSHPSMKTSDVLSGAPYIWLGMTLYLLAYISFTAVFSSSFTPPFAALALGLICFMGLGIASLSEAVKAVWMGDHSLQLWVGAPGAYLLFLGHLVVWAGLAFMRLRTREI